MLTHRWLGVGMCVLFFIWFLSGMVMMYAGHPKLTLQERLAHLPPLENAATGSLSARASALQNPEALQNPDAPQSPDTLLSPAERSRPRASTPASRSKSCACPGAVPASPSMSCGARAEPSLPSTPVPASAFRPPTGPLQWPVPASTGCTAQILRSRSAAARSSGGTSPPFGRCGRPDAAIPYGFPDTPPRYSRRHAAPSGTGTHNGTV